MPHCLTNQLNEHRLFCNLQVQEVPQDEFQRHDLFCGPILRVLCSSKATFLEPVTIQLPVSLGNKLVNIPQPSDCRVRIFFRSPERETKEWVEISDKLENPASYDGKLVKFKVQRFSGYVYRWSQKLKGLLINYWGVCILKVPPPNFFRLNKLSLLPWLLRRKRFWPWIFPSDVLPFQSKEVGPFFAPWTLIR